MGAVNISVWVLLMYFIGDPLGKAILLLAAERGLMALVIGVGVGWSCRYVLRRKAHSWVVPIAVSYLGYIASFVVICKAWFAAGGFAVLFFSIYAAKFGAIPLLYLTFCKKPVEAQRRMQTD